MNNKRCMIALTLCLCAALTLGCQKGPKKVHITGTISVAGEKVETGSVTFVDSSTGMSEGAIIKEGAFDCEVTKGEKKLTNVLGSKVVGTFVPDPLYPDREANKYEDIPGKVFTEEKTINVTKKDEHFDIDYSGEGAK
ncbi:MAG: hypothetical protein IKX88_12495 [Thermoguttaceae bacterium]|nr:hypothetical protein [Thermoguttaceae bacterium]MBR5759404.1 hypothetical protein [Thermoguttaceae bacterium]